MDLKNVFKRMSERLMAEFRLSAEINHAVGKGTFREDAFKNFLKEYLPDRYAVGSGEVISSQNRISGQLDVVIYDPFQCPRLIVNEAHSVFPVESVYGAISVKSHLDSSELADAYSNIVSFKKILNRERFTAFPYSGIAVGMAAPMPVTGIFAFAANRSLDAIKDQFTKLNDAIEDKNLKPDFIGVMELGLIAHQQSLRGDFNAFNAQADDFGILRKTGRHTLMRLYLDVLRELNTLSLRPLDLNKYHDMPRKIGKYLVGRHNRFAKQKLDRSEAGKVLTINEKGIEKIVKKSVAVTLRQHYLNSFGMIPQGAETLCDLEATIMEYNPNKLPPMNFSDMKIISGRPTIPTPCFQPVGIEINGQSYAVGLMQLSDDDFDEDTDFTVEELMSS